MFNPREPTRARAANGGGWGGHGLVTSMPDALRSDFKTSGIAEAAGALEISGNQTALFAGEAVDATSVLVKFTYGGDANLDCKINVDDPATSTSTSGLAPAAISTGTSTTTERSMSTITASSIST